MKPRRISASGQVRMLDECLPCLSMLGSQTKPSVFRKRQSFRALRKDKRGPMRKIKVATTSVSNAHSIADGFIVPKDSKFDTLYGKRNESTIGELINLAQTILPDEQM